MFIGYPNDHAEKVFQFINLDKQSVLSSRNVTWINKSYGDFREIPQDELDGTFEIADLDEYQDHDLQEIDQENEDLENEDLEGQEDPEDPEVIEVQAGEDIDIPVTRTSGLQ